MSSSARSSEIAPSSALRAAERVALKWSLRRELPVLLGREPETVWSWYERPPTSLDNDVLERIRLIVGIYDALHVIFNDSAYADRWINEPNAAFGNKKPAELILGGSLAALADVHGYLRDALA